MTNQTPISSLSQDRLLDTPINESRRPCLRGGTGGRLKFRLIVDGEIQVTTRPESPGSSGPDLDNDGLLLRPPVSLLGEDYPSSPPYSRDCCNQYLRGLWLYGLRPHMDIHVSTCVIVCCTRTSVYIRVYVCTYVSVHDRVYVCTRKTGCVYVRGCNRCIIDRTCVDMRVHTCV